MVNISFDLFSTYICHHLQIKYKQEVSKMDKNYYQTLCVPRCCTQQEIADSYRKLGLRWNPKLAKEDATTAQYHFAEVSEAYDVLSDPMKRAFYDKYGWNKLKEGLFQEGGLKGGYRFGNNANEIFEKFFHSNSTFEQVFDKKITEKGSLFSHAFGGINYKTQNCNLDVTVGVPCTLSQFYKGASLRIQYQRKVLSPDGRSLQTVKTQKLIEIKPGFSCKTVLTYENQGNQTISKELSNLVCCLEEIPHQFYQRQGDDLIYNAKIDLATAISCQPLQLLTLDNRKLRVSLDEAPSPNYLKQVPKEGMPILGHPKQKGGLYIKFNIQFPKNLSTQVKEQLRTLLS